eukprot:2895043-Amphidinium_carterae.2
MKDLSGSDTLVLSLQAHVLLRHGMIGKPSLYAKTENGTVRPSMVAPQCPPSLCIPNVMQSGCHTKRAAEERDWVKRFEMQTPSLSSYAVCTLDEALWPPSAAPVPSAYGPLRE